MRVRNLALVIALLAATALLAHHGPDVVKIDAAAKKQAPVTFSHGKHATQFVSSCDTCHHTQKGLTSDKETNVAKCSTCHLDPKSPNVPSMREASLTKNPFHSLCIDCHKEQKKGPTGCMACHKKA